MRLNSHSLPTPLFSGATAWGGQASRRSRDRNPPSETQTHHFVRGGGGQVRGAGSGAHEKKNEGGGLVASTTSSPPIFFSQRHAPGGGHARYNRRSANRVRINYYRGNRLQLLKKNPRPHQKIEEEKTRARKKKEGGGAAAAGQSWDRNLKHTRAGHADGRRPAAITVAGRAHQRVGCVRGEGGMEEEGRGRGKKISTGWEKKRGGGGGGGGGQEGLGVRGEGEKGETAPPHIPTHQFSRPRQVAAPHRQARAGASASSSKL